MGFFGDLWSGIKNVAGNIWNGVKTATNWVADKVQPIVKAVGDYAGYIPVIGAGISGVATKEVNQAAAKNPAKFPAGYILELTPEEKQEVVKNFDRIKPDKVLVLQYTF
jgi:hypothetical protein